MSEHALMVITSAIKTAFIDHPCHSACNIDPLSRGIGVQN